MSPLFFYFDHPLYDFVVWEKIPPHCTPIQKASVTSPFYEKKALFFLKNFSKFFQVTAESHLQAIELEILKQVFKISNYIK